MYDSIEKLGLIFGECVWMIRHANFLQINMAENATD